MKLEQKGIGGRRHSLMPLVVAVLATSFVGCETMLAKIEGDGFEIQAWAIPINVGRSHVAVYKVPAGSSINSNNELFYFDWQGVTTELDLITDYLLDVNMGVRVIVPLHFDLGEARMMRPRYMHPKPSQWFRTVPGTDEAFSLDIFIDIGEVGSDVVMVDITIDKSITTLLICFSWECVN